MGKTLNDRQKRKAREEFDRRKRDYRDSTVTAGTDFNSWLTTYIATDGYGTGAFSGGYDSSSSYDSGSSSSSYDSGSSSYDSGSSPSSYDSGSSYSDGGGGGSW